MEQYQINVKRWLESSKVNEDLKAEIRAMKETQLQDAFYKDIEFGTAGMRGIMGPGTNRFNVFTLRKANIGFAKYLLTYVKDAKSRGVVIAHDNRLDADKFQTLCADVLRDFGIKVYVFDSLRPTPELSFAVRELKTAGGIMITASHNPKEYNGYKIYDEQGAQLVPHKIAPLIDIIAKLDDEINLTYEKDEVRGALITLDESIDNKYVDLVKSIGLNKNLDKSNYKIVFTPQHGASYVNAMRVFKELGYEIYPVLSQCNPDPYFKGTITPNPEDPRAYEEAIKLAKKEKAQLIVTTDPDGDRCGLGFLTKEGEYKLLTGNQSAAILLDYILKARQEKGLLSKNGVVYNTIVTSPFGNDIAKSYGVKVESFLTGFKFIGEQIHHYEVNDGPHFEFGYEESYGCLIKDFVRDKDATQAIVMYAEMALYYYRHGLDLDDVYLALEQRHGFHEDEVYSLAFEGVEGANKLKALLSNLRTSPITYLFDSEVIRSEDYGLSIAKEGNKEFTLTLPKSDVFRLFLRNGDIVAIRPSGTEPKCKFYIMAYAKDDKVQGRAKKLYEALLTLLNLK